MLIFVLWQDKQPDERRALERVAPSLERVFEPILGEGPTIHSRSDYHRILRSVFSSAPAGKTAVSRNLHSAINSFRANATIPIFRIRLLPEPNRRSYHFESSLSG